MSASGALAHRFGVEQALSVSAIIFGATLCALLDASSESWVATALIVSGFVGGVVDVLMNAEGARIERALGRPILARLHAAASTGMALGAILGSLIAASPRLGRPGFSPRSFSPEPLLHIIVRLIPIMLIQLLSERRGEQDCHSSRL
jgi:predicted MFS family arabinose efflux permease